MVLFLLFIITGIGFAIIHGIYLHMLGNYLETHHRDKWEEIVPKKFLWMSKDCLESRNYFSEMSFVFSSDDMDDDIILSLKRKIILFLILAVLSLVFEFILIFFI